ncbi:MAG TPA: hypothetical protein VKM54_01275 [Myxococcota bacterium]|nr:hypothetical protein [Myxococcota bacterium]
MAFDWQYALRQQNRLALYEKGKAATWNAADLPWHTEVDIERISASARPRAAAGS